MVITDGTVKTG